jgi:hypothetical protein
MSKEHRVLMIIAIISACSGIIFGTWILVKFAKAVGYLH